MIEGAAGAQISISLDRRPVSARLARRAMLRLLGDVPPVSFVRDAVLLTSELVSNAVLHGSGSCELRAVYSTPPDHLRVEVSDDSSDMPALADAADQQSRVGGLGLVLVAEVAAKWGVDARSTTGKSVWFEMSG